MADSMQSAAAQTGHSMGLLKLAKNLGCVAFRGSRVDLFQLEEWLALNPQAVAEEERLMTIQQAEVIERVAKALARRQEYQKRSRELISVTEMRRTITRGVVGIKARFLAIPTGHAQSLAIEDDPVEVEQELRKAICEALTELEKSEWAKCLCPKCGAEVTP